MLDQAGPVRAGQELNIKNLSPWLERTCGGSFGDLEVLQFPSGHSNLTYLLKAGDRQMVLRLPPPGSKARTAHDMGREYRILSALAPHYEFAPTPLAECDSSEVLGAPFYVMERVEGVILRGSTAPELFPDAAGMEQAGAALVDMLIEIHGVDLDRCGLSGWGRPEGYVERQVTGWSDRYQRSRTDDVPDMKQVGGWLAQHQPATTVGGLIHNDFKYDNVVYAPDDFSSVRAVLDWEMGTVGHPLMDLGVALGYWADPDDPAEFVGLGLSPTTVSGNQSRRDVAQRYATATGRTLDDIVFFYVFGLFKIAVIVQQIYYRYARGEASDERFARLIQGVRVCAGMAAQAASLGRIDDLFRD